MPDAHPSVTASRPEAAVVTVLLVAADRARTSRGGGTRARGRPAMAQRRAAMTARPASCREASEQNGGSRRFPTDRSNAKSAGADQAPGIEAAGRLDDLRVPPGNRLELLQGDRRGQYSLRVNEQWRICFVWRDGGAWEVEIVDYH